MFGKKKNSSKPREGTKSKDAAAFARRRSPMRPFWALVCVALAILAALAAFGYTPGQPVYFTKWLASQAGGTVPSNNPVGTLGATYAALTALVTGYSGLILIPVFAAWVAALFLLGRAHAVRPWKLLVMAATILAASGLADILYGWRGGAPSDFFPNGDGGITGELLHTQLLLPPLGAWGSGIVLGLCYVIALAFVLMDHPGQLIEGLLMSFSKWREQRAEMAKLRQLEQQKEMAARAAAQKVAAAEAAKAAASSAKNATAKGGKETPAKVAPDERGHGTLKLGENVTFVTEPSGDDSAYAPKDDDEKKTPARGKAARDEEDEEEEEKKPFAKTPVLSGGLKIIEEEKVEKASPAQPKSKGDYIFPTVDLLAPAQQRQTDSAEFHQERAEQLVRTLAEFGVKVQPTEIHAGPVITRYEVTPAPGVRVEKIVNLDKNLALALKAEGVRIIAPVPGKGTVGIEVPNRQPASVCLREIIESRAWVDSQADIPVVLGKDVTGKPMVADLTKMPHALIAGATGAGKTVCINAIIASLLFKMGPDDLRFIMVDPKIVEMQIFNDLPHMLVPVVTSPKKVPAALKYLIREMERRYQMFAQLGARNIAGFNAKILQDKSKEEKAEELEAEMSPEERAATRDIVVPRDTSVEIERKKLPYIVCIIDELADLMMVAPADIETCVARLAQLARAAGIHLILATQRPSVNVITGVIKANLPCRIAFKVASKVDSRTILDTGGADALIGRGDMLFVPPGSANLVRAQGAFVSDDEINGLVEFLKRNGPPEFADDVQAQIEAGIEGEEGEGGEAEDEGWDDKMVPAAIDVLKATKRASTSMLQRRLKIGYNRAARIMEILEAEGIVGPENGSSPREILKDLEML